MFVHGTLCVCMACGSVGAVCMSCGSIGAASGIATTTKKEPCMRITGTVLCECVI